MISRQLSAKLRPFAFAAAAAFTGVAGATVGLSPAENAASQAGNTTVTQVIAAAPMSAITKLVTVATTLQP